MNHADRLLHRFLQYVQVDTTADESTDQYPSSAGQRELGRLLVDQLTALGLNDVHHDAHGLVHALIPATVSHAVPTVVLNAHLDTSPEAPGAGVRPQVIEHYAGDDIRLPGDPRQVIRVDEHRELTDVVGKTVITSDGTTLLGADDKAGVAVIMETAALLCAQADRWPHGPVRLLFTCDEEIGRGVDHVDVPDLKATVGYTLDGPGAGHIDVETFSADLATVSVTGVNIHTAIAQGHMVNAVRVISAVIDRLPRDFAPEATSGRQGFLHPYTLTAQVAAAELKILLRDFQTAQLAAHRATIERIVHDVARTYPSCQIQLDVTPQYRNLGDGLAREPRAVAFAESAFARLGLDCTRSIIRGGTDGSRLTEMGLPTPNLSTGQHNPHSLLEWACLEEMQQATAVTLELLRVWAEATQPTPPA